MAPYTKAISIATNRTATAVLSNLTAPCIVAFFTKARQMAMEDSTMPTGQATRDPGSPTCATAKAKKLWQVAQFTKAIGRTAYDRVMERRPYPMVEFIVASFTKVISKAMESLRGQTEEIIEDSGSLEKWMESVRWSGLTVAGIAVTGEKAKWMAKVTSSSETVARIAAATNATSKRDTAYTSIQ